MTTGSSTGQDVTSGVHNPARVESVRRLDPAGQVRRADLDALARLAARVCDVPTAAVNILDDERQTSLGAFGFDPPDVPVDETLCAKAIVLRDVTYTSNAGADERWIDNPFTDGRYAEIKLYAAAPQRRSCSAAATSPERSARSARTSRS